MPERQIYKLDDLKGFYGDGIGELVKWVKKPIQLHDACISMPNAEERLENIGGEEYIRHVLENDQDTKNPTALLFAAGDGMVPLEILKFESVIGIHMRYDQLLRKLGILVRTGIVENIGTVDYIQLVDNNRFTIEETVGYKNTGLGNAFLVSQMEKFRNRLR